MCLISFANGRSEYSIRLELEVEAWEIFKKEVLPTVVAICKPSILKMETSMLFKNTANYIYSISVFNP